MYSVFHNFSFFFREATAGILILNLVNARHHCELILGPSALSRNSDEDFLCFYIRLYWFSINLDGNLVVSVDFASFFSSKSLDDRQTGVTFWLTCSGTTSAVLSLSAAAKSIARRLQFQLIYSFVQMVVGEVGLAMVHLYLDLPVLHYYKI
jgi:hypothetical protein